MSTSTTAAKAHANQAARSRPMEVLARLGLATRGVLYLIVAVIVIEILRTRGTADEQASNRGALADIADRPFGRFLLVVVAVGVAGYALWRFAAAWLGHDDKLPKRLANVGRGVIYVGLLVTTISLLLRDDPGSGQTGTQGGSGGSGREQVNTVFDWPAGRWIVAAVALGVLAVGVYSLVRAVTGKWRKHLDIDQLSEPAEKTVVVVAWVGLLGRTIAYGLVGWFLLRAAVQFDPNEPVGLDESLRRVAQESWGPLVLVVTAIGLAGYGLFSFVEARWRRVFE